jgi:uncharacterized protein YqeY
MEAMKSRDAVATSAIRSALGAVDNAKSVGVTDRDVPVGADYIAGSVEGLGAGDVPQREMDDEQIIEIVLVGMRDREGVAGEYSSLGRTEYAARLRSEAEVLLGLLPGESSRVATLPATLACHHGSWMA